MAFFITIRSTFFLLLITLGSSSYGSVVDVFKKVPEIVDHTVNLKPTTALNDNPKGIAGKKLPNNPVDHTNVGESYAKIDAFAFNKIVKLMGEQLAYKYFGPFGRKGFRGVWKAGKGYVKIANRCDKYQHRLNPVCPRQFNLSPNCVGICVVQTTSMLVDNSVVNVPSCTVSCDYPPDATCEIDETVNRNCTPLIN